MEDPAQPDLAKIEAQLLDRHGPLMTGDALVEALGFVSAQAFRQARRRGQIGVPTFRVPGRRGTFAHTSTVARWLADLAGVGAVS